VIDSASFVLSAPRSPRCGETALLRARAAPRRLLTSDCPCITYAPAPAARCVG
jgi:hypothetical protein